MDGVFMNKLLKRMAFFALLAALVWCGMVIADRQKLDEELIRLHIVADSDEEQAQSLKLRVRDAIVESLCSDLKDVADTQQAWEYLEEHLPQIQQLANRVLQTAGSELTAAVSLAQEEFSAREYDTFSLPAGVYNALRVVIGEGEGENWWCVAFPQLCLPTTKEDFHIAAAGAGFSDELTDTLSHGDGTQLRFFILDVLGRIENFFHRG